jgi:hypothetical protein
MSTFRNNFLSKPQSYDGDTWLLVNDYKFKLHCLSGERFENWTMQHERLLTNLKMSKIGIGSNMCSFCGNIRETVIHAMRDCALV